MSHFNLLNVNSYNLKKTFTFEFYLSHITNKAAKNTCHKTCVCVCVLYKFCNIWFKLEATVKTWKWTFPYIKNLLSWHDYSINPLLINLQRTKTNTRNKKLCLTLRSPSRHIKSIFIQRWISLGLVMTANGKVNVPYLEGYT